MPNQNPPDPTKTQDQNTGSSIPFSPQADLPPLPPEFQSLTTAATTTPPEQPEKGGSGAPPVPEFSGITPSPKKKYGSGKIIATILGIFMLLGGLGAGIFLIGQKQLFNQKATYITTPAPTGGSNCTCDSGWSGPTTDNMCYKGGGCPSYVCPGACVAPNSWIYDGSGGSYCSNNHSITCNGACQQASCSNQTPSPPSSTCSGCGVAPNPLPSFNAPPTQVGPFTASGNLIIYYTGLDVKGNLSVYITSHDGNHVVNMSTTDKSRILTNVPINAGETITITKIEEPNQGSPECAPASGPPYLSTGWMSVNPDTTCGSGLMGPPTGGQCTPMSKYNVAPAIAWAQSYNDTSYVGQQCWADWKEWVGDYDFNDYFLMYAVSTSTAPSCTLIETYDSSWTLIPASQRSSIAANTPINFCVSGTAPSGTFDMARFTINGTSYPDTTTQRPGSTDYCQAYTVQSGTISVSAQIHHSVLGWF